MLRFGLTDVPLSTDMLGRISAGEGSLSEFRGVGERGVAMHVARLFVESITPIGNSANLRAVVEGQGSVFEQPMNTRKNGLRLGQILIDVRRIREGEEIIGRRRDKGRKARIGAESAGHDDFDDTGKASGGSRKLSPSGKTGRFIPGERLFVGVLGLVEELRDPRDLTFHEVEVCQDGLDTMEVVIGVSDAGSSLTARSVGGMI